jgi:hypothetical protein
LYELKRRTGWFLTPIVVGTGGGVYTFPARMGERGGGKGDLGTVNEGSTAAETDREAKTSTREDQTGRGSPWMDDRVLIGYGWRRGDKKRNGTTTARSGCLFFARTDQVRDFEWDPEEWDLGERFQFKFRDGEGR